MKAVIHCNGNKMPHIKYGYKGGHNAEDSTFVSGNEVEVTSTTFSQQMKRYLSNEYRLKQIQIESDGDYNVGKMLYNELWSHVEYNAELKEQLFDHMNDLVTKFHRMSLASGRTGDNNSQVKIVTVTGTDLNRNQYRKSKRHGML